MNIEKLFPIVAYIVFRVKRIACVSVVNTELNFGSDADSVLFLEVAATPTPTSLLEQSVYKLFFAFCLFWMTSLNLFW